MEDNREIFEIYKSESESYVPNLKDKYKQIKILGNGINGKTLLVENIMEKVKYSNHNKLVFSRFRNGLFRFPE
jgi:hypothetical protein